MTGVTGRGFPVTTRPRFEPFRIKGLNPHLDERFAVASHQAARDLDLRSFPRRVVD